MSDLDNSIEIQVDVIKELDNMESDILSQDEDLQIKLNVDVQKLLAHYSDNGFNVLRTATVLAQISELYQKSILETWKQHCKDSIVEDGE